MITFYFLIMLKNNFNKKIKARIDKAVIDYVEKRISIYDLEKIINKFDKGKIFSRLQGTDHEFLITIIDSLSDISYYLHNETFNHHDPGNILKQIDNYYKEIN